MATRQVSHFVRVTDNNLKCRLRGLLHAHAGLCLALWSLPFHRWLYGRRSPEPSTIVCEIGLSRPGCAYYLGESRGWLRAASGQRFFLRGCGSFVGGGCARFGRCFSQRTQRIDGVIDSFEACRLCADLASSSWASSSRRANLCSGGFRGRGFGGSYRGHNAPLGLDVGKAMQQKYIPPSLLSILGVAGLVVDCEGSSAF